MLISEMVITSKIMKKNLEPQAEFGVDWTSWQIMYDLCSDLADFPFIRSVV